MVRACGRARRGSPRRIRWCGGLRHALGGCHDRGSSAADGAGTDAGTSQVATPAQPDAAVSASSAAPEAAQPAAAQPAAAGEGGAAGEGETAGDESFEGVYVISAAANSKAVLSTAGSQFYSGANVGSPPRTARSSSGGASKRWARATTRSPRLRPARCLTLPTAGALPAQTCGSARLSATMPRSGRSRARRTAR